AGAVLASIVSPLAGRVSDRRGRKFPMLIGIGCGVGCFLIFTVPLGLAAVMAVTVVYVGWAFTLSTTPAVASVSESAERTRHSTAAPAILLVTFAGGDLVGSIGGAGLAELLGDALVVWALAVLNACIFALLWADRFTQRPRSGHGFTRESPCT